MEDLMRALTPEPFVQDHPRAIKFWLRENARELRRHYGEREIMRLHVRRKGRRCRSTRTI